MIRSWENILKLFLELKKGFSLILLQGLVQLFFAILSKFIASLKANCELGDKLAHNLFICFIALCKKFRNLDSE